MLLNFFRPPEEDQLRWKIILCITAPCFKLYKRDICLLMAFILFNEQQREEVYVLSPGNTTGLNLLWISNKLQHVGEL